MQGGRGWRNECSLWIGCDIMKEKELTQEQKEAVKAYIASRKRAQEEKRHPLFLGLLGYAVLVIISVTVTLGTISLYGEEVTQAEVMGSLNGIISVFILSIWLDGKLSNDSQRWKEAEERHMERWGWLLK